MDTGNSVRSEYDRSIDFVRFVAFFLVFYTHFINRGGNSIPANTDAWWNNPLIQLLAHFGGQGVPVFFFLTGFLLGRLLYKEYLETHRISIKSFFIRRMLRIWPLYFLFIALCSFANLFASTPTLNAQEIPYLFTFSYNWGQIFASLPGSMASITWSISVEEQIYLLLPLLLLFIPTKRFGLVITLFLSVGIFTTVSADFGLPLNTARNTFAYLLPVGFGLLLATHEESLRMRMPRGKFLRLLAISLFILYPITFSYITSYSLLTFCLTPLWGFSVLILADQYIDFSSLFGKISSRIGRISYGCYLYHWAIWTVIVGRNILSDRQRGISFWGVIVCFVITVIVSELSYRYLETPFLRLRKRFQVVPSP